MLLTHPLDGITVPLVTPLLSATQLDCESLEQLCNHVITGGVRSIFVLGTTGEGPALSAALRRQVIERTCAAAKGKVPVLVGITDSSTAEAEGLAEYAAQAGASAVVYAGPVYFPVSAAELETEVARLVERLPLPVYLYNMPSHTHVVFDPDTVGRLSALRRVVGLKDSSGNLMYFQKVREAVRGRADFGLLMGPEELMGAAMMAGATGGVNGGSNIYPRLYVALYKAAARRDWAEAERLQQIVLRLSRGIYSAGTYSSSYLKGMKCALSIAGLCGTAMAVPYEPWGDDQRRQIAATMGQLQGEFPAFTSSASL